MNNNFKDKYEMQNGRPAICIPITGRTKEDIMAHAANALGSPCDLIEWRADYFDGIDQEGSLDEVLGALSKITGRKDLLFTFRSKKEGGVREISFDSYRKMLLHVSALGLVQLIDVEVFMDENQSAKLIRDLQENGSMVIGSHHDFDKTPDREEMLSLMKRTQDMGADIIKLAVMPGSFSDVIRLMEVTHHAKTHLLSHPLITISMGKDGLISRLCGQITGSCLSFATAGEASAPGQIDAADLSCVLEIIDKNTGNS